MRQLQVLHILLFRMLKEHFLFLNRKQIERVLTLPTNSTNKQLGWMVSEKYLEKRYRADSFRHFQTPLYYLGTVGWRMAGQTSDRYKRYQRKIEERAERPLEHLLAIYDVLLKFVLESGVQRIIVGEGRFWQESLGFGNIPDAWVQFTGGEAFIEVDRETEASEVVQNKIKNYIEFKQSGRYRILFPGCGFKLLFITTTEKRIELLEPLAARDDIWFATLADFLRERLDHQHWFARDGFHALPIATKEEV